MSQKEEQTHPPSWPSTLNLTRQTPSTPSGTRANHRSRPCPGGPGGCPEGGGVHSNLVSACWDEGAKLIGHQEMLQDESALSKIHTHTCHSLKQQS